MLTVITKFALHPPHTHTDPCARTHTQTSHKRIYTNACAHTHMQMRKLAHRHTHTSAQSRLLDKNATFLFKGSFMCPAASWQCTVMVKQLQRGGALAESPSEPIGAGRRVERETERVPVCCCDGGAGFCLTCRPYPRPAVHLGPSASRKTSRERAADWSNSGNLMAHHMGSRDCATPYIGGN